MITFPIFSIRFPTGTLRRQRSCQNNLRTIQGDGVLARPIDLFRDETPRANLIHPGNLDLGFAQGVSSFLTPNGFRFECEFLVSGDERCQAKGNLQKNEGSLPTGARDESKKGAAICGVIL
jgi:hypothetical protein